MTTELRDRLAAACRHVARRGLSPGGSGNLSVRLDDALLVTPGGSSRSRARPDDLAVAPLHGPYAGAGPRPTKELALHQAVYRVRPDVTAIVHLHSHYAVAASCLEPTSDGTAALPALTPYQVLRLGTIPVAPYAPPGSQALADHAAALIEGQPVLLLANHGSVAVGADLDQAVDLAEELEAACRLFFTLVGFPHRCLSAADVDELRRG